MTMAPEPQEQPIRLSLKLKLSALITALLILTVALVSTFLLRHTQQSVTREMAKRGLTSARTLANSARSSVVSNDELTLSVLVREALRNQDIAYLIVTDLDDKVLAHSDLSWVGQRLERPRELTAVREQPLVQPLEDPRYGRLLDFAMPLMFSQVRLGALYLGISQRPLEQALAKARTQTTAISVALVALGIGAAVALASVMTRPILRLVNGTRAIAAGDLNVTLPVPSGDEIGLLTDCFNQMARSLREKETITRAFSRYVARQVVDEILKDPERLVLKEERRDVTVLFCQIRDFVRLAEQLPPEEIVQLLNDFYGLMIDATFEHEGTLNEFFGDGVMAFFGAPIRDEEHPLHAIRTALAMKAGVLELRERRAREGRLPIGLGIGLDAGEVIAGTVGTEDRMKYAVVGDTVNLAARLEAKAEADQILITRSTYERVKDRVDARSLGLYKMKGKQQDVEVFEVLGFPPPGLG